MKTLRLNVNGKNSQFREVDTRVVKTRDLLPNERDSVHELFEFSYEKANHSYLEKSLGKLSYIALAYHENKLVSFAVGDIIESIVPRMPEPQIVHAGGISCIGPEFRRMGLFRNLQMLIADSTGLIKPGTRFILCGRMAHPASSRVISSYAGAIPKNGVVISEWQKEIGVHIAGLYDVSIDPDTFVVRGEGSPIGYPKMNVIAKDEEWALFKDVNRDRGDSLLFVAWYPDPPKGW